ncbi:MAG: lipoprotein [Woeseiaceae bacterium]|nr:lipoprotein [Woeseiaceae bacterium]
MPNTPRLTLALLVLAVAGCGQSGPLYLPGNPSEVRQPPGPADSPPDEAETAPPADSEDEDDEDDVRR